MFGLYCLAGAATGGSRLRCIEGGRSYRVRLAIYVVILSLGFLLVSISLSRRCPGDLCTSQKVMGGLLGCLAGFFFSMGCAGVLANYSIRGTTSDSGRNFFDSVPEDEEGISLSASYEPITRGS